ncbi:MAG: hypothetical protein LBH16_09750 [Treponema sp.]|jgi:hypothetical protein|nr:hypothetical protein [Treponema sp.]
MTELINKVTENSKIENELLYVPVERKNFVGIGKMVFEKNKEWNIPHLHFMVDETVSGNFEATLLEFGLVSWSETEEAVIKSLVRQTHVHILMVMDKSGFDGLIKNVDDHVMDDYWRHYRKIEFTMARSGKDLSHKLDNQIVRAIKEMLSEDTKNIIREIAMDNAEKLVAIIDKIYTLTPYSFTYNEIKDAA